MLGLSALVLLANKEPMQNTGSKPALAMEAGFQRYGKLRGELTAREWVQSCEPGKTVEIMVCRPPNLPTQEIISDSVTVEGGRVLRKISGPLNRGQQQMWCLEVMPEAKTMTVIMKAEIWSYIQANAVSTEPVTMTPQFVSLGEEVSYDYEHPKFQEWYKKWEMQKGESERWSEYIERTYKVLDKCFKYSKIPAGPGGRRGDSQHASGICQLTEFGCQTAATLYGAVLRKQHIPCFQVYGGFWSQSGNDTLSHSFLYANLAPYGWKLLDPTSALDGKSYGASEGVIRYFVLNAVQIAGFMDVERRNLKVGSTSAYYFINAGTSAKGGGMAKTSPDKREIRFRKLP
ncbi:MAG: hypothetical protein WCK51_11495 [Armatimonadota bacterium]